MRELRWRAAVAAIAGMAIAGTAGAATMPAPSWLTRHSPPRRALAPPALAATAAFGPDVRVNDDPATTQLGQVEPGIASDPADPRRLVAGYADVQNPVAGAESDADAADTAPGVSLSRDGARTWRAPTGGPVLPDPPGFAWGDRTEPDRLAAGDSALAWGVGGRVFFSTLGFHDVARPPNGDCAGGGIYVFRSDDAGETWTLPAGGPAFANLTTTFRDKEYVAADAEPSSPHVGNLYVAWDDDTYAACPERFPDNFVGRRIAFARSEDGGATWSAPSALATGCLAAPVPAVARNGDVYVAWFDCNAATGSTEMVARSLDGGRTFQTPRAAAFDVEPPLSPLIGSAFRVPPSFPALATDPTDAARLYVTWSANDGAAQSDVFVSRSLDGGGSWSAPFRVNDDPPGNPRDQFFPWIAVTAAGTVRVMWGDDRLDAVNAGGHNYDVFVADSDDHGATFGANVRVTTVSSNPDTTAFAQPFIGDYFGLSASGVPIWTDTRNGNDDVFAAPLAALTVCGDADGNGDVTVTDGVQVLRAAAELPSSCTPAVCDVDGDGSVGVTDGVNVLREAAGLSAPDACSGAMD